VTAALWLAAGLLAAGIVTVVEGFVLIGQARRIQAGQADTHDLADRVLTWVSDHLVPALWRPPEAEEADEPAATPEPEPAGPSTQPNPAVRPGPLPGPRTVPSETAVDHGITNAMDAWVTDYKNRRDAEMAEWRAKLDAETAAKTAQTPRKRAPQKGGQRR
jgi:hypothetical protein